MTDPMPDKVDAPTQPLAQRAVAALAQGLECGATCQDCGLHFDWRWQTKHGHCPECNSSNWDRMTDVEKLQWSIRLVNENHPLPRCIHGRAFRDGSGEWLVMECGCIFPRDWNENPKHTPRL